MNTRVAVPLSEEAYEAVSLIAEIGGVSRGRLLAEALDGVVPSFIAIAAAYRAAQAVHGSEKEAMREAMSRAENKLLEALEDALSDVNEETDRLHAHGATATGARGRSDPPVTNRGVPKVDKGGVG